MSSGSKFHDVFARGAGLGAICAIAAWSVECFGGPVAVASSSSSTSTPAAASGKAPALVQRPWADIEKEARGKTVVFGMWSGNDSINGWVDGFVGPRVKALYGITLKRQPQKDPVEFVNKSLNEKQAKKDVGSTDLVWINGENFKLARKNDLLFGPFAHALPSFQKYYDAASPDIAFDFGTPVEGFEAPYGKAQFAFTYNSEKVPVPPTDLAELAAWCKKNPGKFTYPAPPDFTGSAFVRQVVYATTGGHAQYLGKVDLALLRKNLPKATDFLHDLKPCLWRKGTTYPDSLARLNQLYADGEVWMTMAYSPVEAENQVRKGAFPKASKTFVTAEGTLANTHFLAIPFNAPNKEAALVLAHFLLSPEAQLSKFDPRNWGDFPALEQSRLDAADRKKFESVKLGAATLPLETLSKNRVPEIAPEYLIEIEKAWTRVVPK